MPPKVPGDDPVGEKTVFWKTAAEVVLESKNGLPDAPGDSPDGSGLGLKWLQKSQVLNPNSTFTNFMRTGFWDSRLKSDAKRLQISQMNF